ncbi:molybdopterin cofactor-binding domain-containing protein [Allomuricauda sp. SCSIO 65647]|uniref:xanthine dehydrogenase family protein molybdopterin-binding subunit n=1 Tax=Allomuricauda sp. SCSIO 65647 TaxID=2908843 RepID=UPI001F450A3F|nr:molybdopterin cofactor-binding domain-containing protein [Muricauda sp. SCSIO 65647]UJH67802.1 molybdopterin-dependent oxidoreductase [Muricauda sp. SCSIO 65647]
MGKNKISRRNFIRNTSFAGSGLVIGLNFLESCVGEVTVNTEFKKPLVTSENVFHQDGANSITDFLQIRSDGKIFVSLTKYEMGQGVSTGLSAIIAEELEADWSKINIRYAGPIKDVANITGGSTSILSHWDLLRKAGAFAKNLLIGAAAKEWSVYVDECIAKKSVVQLLGTDKKLDYGQLAEKVVVPENYRELFDETPLKYRSKFTLVGNSLESKIIPDIVTGKHPYSIDLKLPGMKYAAVARCPVFMGSLENYDDSVAIDIPGVEKVVPVKGVVLDDATHVRDGIAVIANTTWAAFKGKEAVIAEWNLGEKAKIDSDDFVKNCYGLLESEQGREILVDGPIEKVEGHDKTISHTYEFPYQHHACMEPLNATAQYRTDSCEIWVGTQSADKIMGNVEKHFGIPKEKIKVNCHPSGGGFGLRYSSAYALEALIVSEAAGGDLVKMCYSREDDIKFDYLNPFELNKHTVQIKKGRIMGWNLKNVMDNWGGLSAWLYYDIPNRSANEIKVKGFTQMGAWRSVMANAEGFSTECFIDEVAFELKRDPLEFRLSMLPANKMLPVNHRFECDLGRLRGALILAAKKAGWGEKLPSGSGKGIAAYPYMHGNGYGAAVTDVSIKEGVISVDKVTIAVDCGLVVNPNLVKQQMEGGIIWALSAIFYGGTEYKDGVVQRNNFHDNKVLTINEIPEIEVHICKNDESKPWGVGEIAGPVTYASVCNAIFDATGDRIRKLPIGKVLLNK